MEESLSMLKQISRTFGGCDSDIRAYSPLTFAYIGDAVFEIVIRTVIIGSKGQRSINSLHKQTTRVVCARTQALIAEAVYDRLTEEEQDIYRRGKNAKIHSSAKNASLSEYHKATGFEALLGYLFMRDEVLRITEIVREGIELAGIEL